MSKKFSKLPPFDKDQFVSNPKSAEKRRRALLCIFDSFPAQVDAIKNQKENDAIELRRFMVQREKDERMKRSSTARSNRWAKPVTGLLWAPEQKSPLPTSISRTMDFSKK